MAKENKDGADDYSAQLAELESEQFKDGVETPLVDETTGKPIKVSAEEGDEDADEKDGDEEGEDDAEEGDDEDDAEEGDEDDAEEGDEDDAEEGDEDDEDDEKPTEGKKPSRAERRIRGLRAQVGALQRQLDAVKKKQDAPRNADGTEMTAEQYAKDKLAKDEKAPKKPDPSKFELGEFDPEYLDAYDDYRDERSAYLQKARAEFTASATDAAPSAPGGELSEEEFRTKLDEVVELGKKRFKDFDAVVVKGVEKGTWDLAPATAALIVTSEVGPEIAYHLASNPKLAKEIAGLPDLRQAMRFGKLEDKFLAERKAKTKPKASSAPKPLSSVRGGGASATAGFDSEDFEAVERRWQSGNKRRGG